LRIGVAGTKTLASGNGRDSHAFTRLALADSASSAEPAGLVHAPAGLAAAWATLSHALAEEATPRSR